MRRDGVTISERSAMSTRKQSVRARATADDLRRIALALPEAVETITWGEPHFRVQNKIFTSLGTREGRAVSSVKLEKSHAEVRLFDPRFRPAPYVGRYGWVEFALEDVTVGELEELVAESHRLVAKAKPDPAKPRAAPSRRGRARP
jgi:predicted DNA-binding protein (MmcQ/YjbR family)